jgi:hypothetical protein
MAGATITQVQLGDSVTASQNFVLASAAANGTMKLSRGNYGSTTQDIFTVPASGAMKIVGANLIAQVVSTTVGTLQTGTTTFASSGVPQNTSGIQFLSQAITPTNASSTLEIDVALFLSNSSLGSASFVAALFQDANANGLAGGMSYYTSGNITELAFKHLMVAGTITATTFKVRAGSTAAGTTYLNGSGGSLLLGGLMSSRITIKEYLP